MRCLSLVLGVRRPEGGIANYRLPRLFFIYSRICESHGIIPFYMRKKVLLWCCLVFLTLVGCRDKEVAEPFLELDKNMISVGADPCFAQFQVTSNKDWSVLCDCDWVTLSPEIGKGSPEPITVNVMIRSNKQPDMRIAVLNVYSGYAMETLVIHQEGVVIPDIVPEVYVSESNLELSAEEGVVQISVESNVRWEASTTVDWISLNPTSGIGAGQLQIIEIQYSANESELQRNAVIRITAEKEIVEVAIKQKGIDIPDTVRKELQEGSYWIVIDDYVATPLNSAYGYLAVEKMENGASVEANSFVFSKVGDYYSLKDAYGKYYYQKGTYDSFDVADTFEATDNFRWQIEPVGENLWRIVNVATLKFIQYSSYYQSFGCYYDERGILPMLVLADSPNPDLPHLEVYPNTITVSYEDIIEHLTLTCNTDWVSYIDADWLEINPATGAGSEYVELKIDANHKESSRQATISIFAGSLMQSLCVTQSGFEPILSISRSSVDVTYKEGDFTLDLQSNSSWTASSVSDWVTVSPSSGSGSDNPESVNISVSANPSESPRTTEVVFTTGSVCKSLIITQEARPKAGIDDGSDAGIDDWIKDDDELNAN